VPGSNELGGKHFSQEIVVVNEKDPGHIYCA
jgi:hypothetical protein